MIRSSQKRPQLLLQSVAQIDPAQESIYRDVLWLEARQNKDGVVDHPGTREVAQRIVSMIKFLSFIVGE